MRRRVTIMALAVMVVACGSEERGATTTSSPADPTTTASTVIGPTTTTVDRTITTSIPATTSTTHPGIDVEMVEGQVVGPEGFEVPLGEPVDIWILSDVDDEIHVHGYDLRFEIAAGEPFNLSFDADVPGIFEVEAHTNSAALFEIEVTG